MSMIGTVLRFDSSRGYGFVAPHDGSPDVFVHESAIINNEQLMKGDKISFGVTFDEKKNKLTATHCQITEYAASRRSMCSHASNRASSYLSCTSDQSRASTVSTMHHSPIMFAPSPSMASPGHQWEQQQFFHMQQQQQQQQFFEQPQMIDHQFQVQQQQTQFLSPTTITTVFVDDVNMIYQ